MKTRILSLATLVVFVLFFVACEEETVQPQNEIEQNENIIPEKFGVDIPSAITQTSYKNARLKSANDDEPISGNDIYGNLTYFISIGESAAEIVEDIIWSIRVHNIEDIIELTYTSDDDNRIKRLVVEKEVEYDNRSWEYMLTLTDLESEGELDGGKGMQVFWNSDPIQGIAIMKPYNIDRVNDAEAQDAMYMVEYSAKGMAGYEEYMIVDLVDLPSEDETDIYAVDNIKMFVGKKGDIVDVYGNSNHPLATFNTYNEEIGYNWAFVASGKQEADIAVAEVGLPYSSINSTSRDVILVENSIKNVLSRELTDYIVKTWAEEGVTLDSAEIAAYLAPSLVNAEAPGYFDTNGFIQGGTAPSDDFGTLEERVLELTPYNPSDISNLQIMFK